MATFEWEGSKARRNRVVHGVAFDEAMSAFGDPLGRIVDDLRHSQKESRYALVAQSERGRVLVIMFTNEVSGSVLSALV